jgi:hypothetical protein
VPTIRVLKQLYILSPLKGEFKIICSCIWHVTLSMTPSPTFLAQIVMNYFKPPLKFTSLSHTFSCLCVFALTVGTKANNAVTTKKLEVNWIVLYTRAYIDVYICLIISLNTFGAMESKRDAKLWSYYTKNINFQTIRNKVKQSL